jgi:hypothetical protein
MSTTSYIHHVVLTPMLIGTNLAASLIYRWVLDRQFGHLSENVPGESGALVAPNGIVDLAPINDAHEEFALAIDGELKELLDLFGAGAVDRKGYDGAGVENDAFHGSRRFTVRGASQLSLSASFLKEIFESFGVFAEAAAQTADKLRSEWLENETVFLFHEGHLGPFFDGVFAAKLRGDDQLAFGGDRGDFGFHAGSKDTRRDKYNFYRNVSQENERLTYWPV